MRCPASGKLLRPRACELLHDAGPFVRHPPYLLKRSLETHELALQFFNCRLNPIAKHTPAAGKEEIAGGGPDQGANERSCCHCRSIVHTTSY